MSKVIFDHLRHLSGGKLTQSQVDAANSLIGASGELLVVQMLGISNALPVTAALTNSQLQAIYPAADLAFVPVINKWAGYYQLTNKKRMAAWLANMLHESGGFKRLRESLNYTPERLAAVFPARVKTLAQAQALVKAGQTAIADHVYGGRYGNTAQGDGYKYRGGGLTHLTFKDNYRAYGDAIGVDLVANPDLIVTPDVAVRTAMEFWKRNDCNALADRDDFTGVVRRINGGTNGIKERFEIFKKCLTLLS